MKGAVTSPCALFKFVQPKVKNTGHFILSFVGNFKTFDIPLSSPPFYTNNTVANLATISFSLPDKLVYLEKQFYW